MTLYNRRSIRSAGSTLHLPPFNAGSPIIEPIIVGSDPIPAPYTSTMVTLYRRRQGWTIDYSFQLFEDSTTTARAFIKSLRNALFDSDNIARSVDFCNWYDSDGVNGEILRDCIVNRDSWDAARFEKFRRCDLSLISRNGSVFQTFSDGSTPGVSPYETYLVNPEGGDPEVPIADTLALTGTFHGVLVETASDQWQHVFTLRSDMRIKGLQITSCSTAGNATSTIRIRTVAWDAVGGSYLAADVAADEYTGDLVSGSIGPILAGAKIYVYVTAAGGHEDVSYQVLLESA